MSTAVDEAELVRRMQRGDSSAFEPLYRHYVGQAVRVAYLITGRQQASEDAAYEAFVRAIRSIHALHNPQLFRGWFYRLLVEAAAQRKAGRWSFLVPGGGRPPEEMSPLSRLPEAELVPLVLSYYVEMSPSEIAHLLSLPLLMVEQRIEHARRRLARYLAHTTELETGLEGGSAGAER